MAVETNNMLQNKVASLIKPDAAPELVHQKINEPSFAPMALLASQALLIEDVAHDDACRSSCGCQQLVLGAFSAPVGSNASPHTDRNKAYCAFGRMVRGSKVRKGSS